MHCVLPQLERHAPQVLHAVQACLLGPLTPHSCQLKADDERRHHASLRRLDLDRCLLCGDTIHVCGSPLTTLRHSRTAQGHVAKSRGALYLTSACVLGNWGLCAKKSKASTSRRTCPAHKTPAAARVLVSLSARGRARLAPRHARFFAASLFGSELGAVDGCLIHGCIWGVRHHTSGWWPSDIRSLCR